jgi:hypothetical protein
VSRQHHTVVTGTQRAIFDAITADTYVISANGKYDNPDHETLKWIVEAAHDAGRTIEIVVTNATKSAKQLKQTHAPVDYGYKLTIKPKTDHSIVVTLAG